MPKAGHAVEKYGKELPIVKDLKVGGTMAARVVGARLYLTQRTTGDVMVIDVSEATKPKLLEKFNLPGNPGRAVVHNDTLIIPNGYEGLWVTRRNGHEI